MEIIKTDVLVVGGGGAGLRAALAAREGGSKVCVAAKSPAGKSTCTYLAAGLFSLAIDGMSKEEHIEETIQTGKGINVEKLVRVLAEDAPDRVWNWRRWASLENAAKDVSIAWANPRLWVPP